MKRFLLNTIRGGVLGILLVGLQGCETTGSSSRDAGTPSIRVARYEIQVSEGDLSRQSRGERASKAARREAALRSIVLDFGGALVDQRRSTEYKSDAKGRVIPNTVWKITVDVDGDRAGENARELRSRLMEAFDTQADVWITRYEVQKILN